MKNMLGELLRGYRYKHDLGMREMAKTLGVSLATYSRIEDGKEVSQPVMVMLINFLFGA